MASETNVNGVTYDDFRNASLNYFLRGGDPWSALWATLGATVGNRARDGRINKMSKDSSDTGTSTATDYDTISQSASDANYDLGSWAKNNLLTAQTGATPTLPNISTDAGISGNTDYPYPTPVADGSWTDTAMGGYALTPEANGIMSAKAGYQVAQNVGSETGMLREAEKARQWREVAKENGTVLPPWLEESTSASYGDALLYNHGEKTWDGSSAVNGVSQTGNVNAVPTLNNPLSSTQGALGTGAFSSLLNPTNQYTGLLGSFR